MAGRSLWLGAVLALLFAGCVLDPKDDDDVSADDDAADDDAADDDAADDDAADDDTGDDDDTVAPLEEAFAWTAGGGTHANGQFQGIAIVGPVDLSGTTAANAQYIWQPGPVFTLGE